MFCCHLAGFGTNGGRVGHFFHFYTTLIHFKVLITQKHKFTLSNSGYNVFIRILFPLSIKINVKLWLILRKKYLLSWALTTPTKAFLEDN